MPLSPGSPAPGFRLALLGGGEVDLLDWLPNAPILLAFFKTTCPTCMLAFPFLERIHRRAIGLRLLAISQDGPQSTARFHEEFGITMPTAIDPACEGYAVSNAYGITHVPSLFMITPACNIEWFSTGFSKPDFEELAAKAGMEVFTTKDRVPVWKPG
jgi:peroxiredoxin